VITLAQLNATSLTPGIVHVEGKRIFVGSGDGSLVLLEVRPEGRKSMSALDFMNGYRIKEGEVLE
jgi:methionyl-tRNA formyltransferase